MPDKNAQQPCAFDCDHMKCEEIRAWQRWDAVRFGRLMAADEMLKWPEDAAEIIRQNHARGVGANRWQIHLTAEQMAIPDERTFRKALSAQMQEFGDGIMAEWRRRKDAGG